MAQRDLSKLVGLRREAGKPVIFSFLYRGLVVAELNRQGNSLCCREALQSVLTRAWS